MALIKPDLSEVQNLGPIEPGTYAAKIVAVEAKVSSKGNPMIVPKFEIQVPGDEKPRTRNSFLVISGEGAYGFGQLLRSTGFGDIAEQLADPNYQPKPEFDTDSLIGQSCQVVIEEAIYNNEKRDSIKSYLPA